MQRRHGLQGSPDVRRRICLAATLALLMAAACDKPKPRHPPPDPMAVAPPPAPGVAPPRQGLSAGLARRTELAGFSIDSIGPAQDPLNHQPALVPAGQPLAIMGFGFDPVVKAPAQGVDLVIDGKTYGTDYGAPRPDVAAYFKTPILTPTGYKVTIPAGTLAPGPHRAMVRVVSSDGASYFDGLKIAFVVK
jgi:hypothetical protein